MANRIDSVAYYQTLKDVFWPLRQETSRGGYTGRVSEGEGDGQKWGRGSTARWGGGGGGQ